MVRVIMHGCNGRMGQVITEMIAKEAEMEIVAGVDVSDSVHNTYPVFKTLKDCDVDADVVIDFANAKAVDGLLDTCVAKSLPCVLCTTGLSEEQLAHVKEASGKVAILRSANMSMGINLLMKLLKDAVPVLAAAGYDMEIVEKHHNQKHGDCAGGRHESGGWRRLRICLRQIDPQGEAPGKGNRYFCSARRDDCRRP